MATTLAAYSRLAQPTVEEFWGFVWERAQIWHRRYILSQPFPWTDDPILQRYHFCNVKRELDAGTIWYKERVACRCRSFRELLWRTIMYRLVNNRHLLGEAGGLGPQRSWPKLVARLRSKGLKVWSPAYRNFTGLSFSSPDRLGRLEEVCEYLDAHIASLACEVQRAGTLRQVSELLQTVPGVGSFIAMQIYRDLILVGQLPFSDNDWVEVGPGAIWTLERLERCPSQDHRAAIGLLWQTQTAAFGGLGLPLPILDGKLLSLCDIEHSLCEFGKYLRIRDWTEGRGPRPKLRYYRRADI